MQFAEADIIQLASDIWSSVLGLNVEVGDGINYVAADDCLIGCVQITGAWRGSVTLEAPRNFASDAAATMFDKPLAGISNDDVVDALAELTNMLGGNIKSVLPGPSYLALPCVTEGMDYDFNIPNTRCLSKVAINCNNNALCVQLFEFDGIKGY